VPTADTPISQPPVGASAERANTDSAAVLRARAAAVSRARWAVIQTGLISTALALFGVYVLATRIEDWHLMREYAFDWVPIGSTLVGFVCGSGYLLAAWWVGLRVDGRTMALVVLLQLAAFLVAHYVDFSSYELVRADTHRQIEFFSYFHQTTIRLPILLPPGDRHTPDPTLGYAMRALEALLFCGIALLTPWVHARRLRCPACDGLVRRREAGDVAAASLTKLHAAARSGEERAFSALLGASRRDAGTPDSVALVVRQCVVCNWTAMESPQSEPPVELPPAVAHKLVTTPLRREPRGFPVR
jgi:hypothetical protein